MRACHVSDVGARVCSARAPLNASARWRFTQRMKKGNPSPDGIRTTRSYLGCVAQAGPGHDVTGEVGVHRCQAVEGQLPQAAAAAVSAPAQVCHTKKTAFLIRFQMRSKAKEGGGDGVGKLKDGLTPCGNNMPIPSEWVPRAASTMSAVHLADRSAARTRDVVLTTAQRRQQQRGRSQHQTIRSAHRPRAPRQHPPQNQANVRARTSSQSTATASKDSTLATSSSVCTSQGRRPACVETVAWSSAVATKKKEKGEGKGEKMQA